MKKRGIIVQFSLSEGFGKILTNLNESVNFERFECNYEIIRIGDEVFFDMVELADGTFDALNIEFAKNSKLSEINRNFQIQSSIKCKIIKKTKYGYIADYKNIFLFISENDTNGENIKIGEEKNLFIKYFSVNGSHIVASTRKNTIRDTLLKYQKFIGKRQYFEFEVIEKNNYGIIVSDKDSYGFIPNSHIIPFDKDDVIIGKSINASVIGCSIQKGLILSIRNYLLYDILEEIYLAYEEQKTLQGSVKSVTNKVCYIDYKEVILVLNCDYLIHEVSIDSIIEFKVIDFSWNKTIAISNAEITKNGLLQKLRNDNMFYGIISKVLNNGLLISINENYTGFMPSMEISDNWRIEYKSLKEGSRIKFSIMKFDSHRLWLSRINFKKNKKMSIASHLFKVGDAIEMKIHECVTYPGLLVKNADVRGLVPIELLVPKEFINKIHLLSFLKFCKNIFKRNSYIKCIVYKIDVINNNFLFNLDYSDVDNRENLLKIQDYCERPLSKSPFCQNS